MAGSSQFAMGQRMERKLPCVLPAKGAMEVRMDLLVGRNDRQNGTCELVEASWLVK